MKTIIGIDEVGRGPVAGPVCVAVFRLRVPNTQKLFTSAKLPLRDSKKLSREQREQWHTVIHNWHAQSKCDIAVSLVHAKTIDRLGISKSLAIAIERSLKKIQAQSHEKILLDGSLYAPKTFAFQETIIKGDEKEAVIALASIIAKVHRDRYMTRLHKRHPEYGFHTHVGYGTKEHYEAIMAHGMVFCHRATFLAKILIKGV